MIKYSDSNARWPSSRENPNNVTRNLSSPWTHIENLVHPLRTYGNSAIGTPRQQPMVHLYFILGSFLFDQYASQKLRVTS